MTFSDLLENSSSPSRLRSHIVERDDHQGEHGEQLARRASDVEPGAMIALRPGRRQETGARAPLLPIPHPIPAGSDFSTFGAS